MLSLEIKIAILAFFLLYFLYFVFSKNYVKTYIPFIGLGFLMGEHGFNLLPSSIKSSALLVLYPALVLLGVQLGRGLGQKFWKNFPLEAFLHQIGEKILLIAVFLTTFILVVPDFNFVPPSLPFYLSIVAFSTSFLFFYFSTPSLKKIAFGYYRINNLILMILFLIFTMVFSTFQETGFSFSLQQKILAVFLPSLFAFFLFKSPIENKVVSISLWLSLMFLLAGFSKILGLSPLISGFLLGIASNFMPLKKQLILKKFFLTIHESLMILFLVLVGFFFKVSLPLLLLSGLYLLMRIVTQISLNVLNFKQRAMDNFFQKSILSLLQGEVFLGFLLYYALEFDFYEILNIALISLIFSEILINYYVSFTKSYQKSSEAKK